MTLPRQLEYKDKFVYHLIRQINGDCEGEAIVFPDNTTPIKFVVEMSLNEFTSILSALMTGADLSYPDESHEVVWRFLRQVECPVSICDEILECLQPAFDEINDKLDDIEDKVDIIDEKIDANAAKPPPGVVETYDARLCGAAVAVTAALNADILRVYAQSESGAFDNQTEAVAAIIAAIPILGQLPFDEMIIMANDYFENQQTQYETDYTAGFNAIVGDLYCKLLAANGVFDFELWGAWLSGLDARVPANRASKVMSAYAPASATFINQIAEFITGENSFEEFFRDIYLYFLTGAETPSFICADTDCGLWRHTMVPDDIGDEMAFVGNGEFVGNVILPTTTAPFGADITGAAFTVTFLSNVALNQIVIHQSAGVFVESSPPGNHYVVIRDGSSTIIFDEEIPFQDGEWTLEFEPALNTVRTIEFAYLVGGDLAEWAWDEVTLAGTGTNPFS